MRLISSKTLFTSSLFFYAITAFNFAYASDDRSTHVAGTEIEWELSTFGPEIWRLYGDIDHGEHVTYIKFPAGTITPLHIHSADYVGVVVTGTTRHRVVGRLKTTDKILPPGSHWTIKANERHVSECLPGLECVMAIYQKEAFDFIPLGPSPFSEGKDDKVENVHDD